VAEEERRAERVARNDHVFRRANDAIEATAERLGMAELLPFICECPDEGCSEIVRLTPEEYRAVRESPRRFLVAHGHQRASGEWGEVVAEHDRYLVEEKLGLAGELVEQLADSGDSPGGDDDPRSAERVRRISENEALFREVNDRIGELAGTFHLTLLDAVCECGDASCTERVALTRADYEAIRERKTRFAVLPGHEIADVEDVVAEGDGYLVIEKKAGLAAEVAAEEG
jgi:hypothetical protein